jgi:hypothetical protein
MKKLIVLWCLIVALASCQKTRESIQPEANHAEAYIANDDVEQLSSIDIKGYPDNMEEESNEKMEGDEFYLLSSLSTKIFAVGQTSTAIVEISMSAIATGREFRLDLVSQNGQEFGMKLRAKVGTVTYPVDSNHSPHDVRKTEKSVYFRRNMLPAGTEKLVLYVASTTTTTVKVKYRIGVSKKAFVKQLHLPNMANYIHFTQKDAPEPLKSKGCGPNTLQHAYHLQQPNIGAFYPNKDNLVALHNRLNTPGSDYSKNLFARADQLHWLATGHKINISGYKDKGKTKDDFKDPSRPGWQGDFGRIVNTQTKLQIDGSRYFPQVDFGYVRNDRNSYKAFLEAPLPRGFAVCTPVLIDGNNPANVKTTGKGHFILLTGISIAADGSGIVFYKDPLTVDTQTRVISYTLLLDSNKANSGTKGNYSGMYPKWIPN